MLYSLFCLFVRGNLFLIDMCLNVNIFSFMRFGLRFNVNGVNLVTGDDCALQLVGVCRYFGIHLVAFCHFKCNLDNCKCVFYCSFNAVYGQIGNSVLCSNYC